MTSAMTSHFGPVNVDFLTSGRTNLKSISHDTVSSYFFFFSKKLMIFFFLRRLTFKTQFYSALTFNDWNVLSPKFESEPVSVEAFESVQWPSIFSIKNQPNFNFNLAYT